MAASSPTPGSRPEHPVLAAGVLVWAGEPGAPRFLLLRNARHGSWGFPKGHLEAGEDLRQGALRELREETAYTLDPGDLDPEWCDTSLYRAGEDGPWKRVLHYLPLAPVDPKACVRSAEHDDHTWAGEEEALRRLAFDDLRRTWIRAAARLAGRG